LLLVCLTVPNAMQIFDLPLLMFDAIENVWSHYSEKGNRIGSQDVGDRARGDIIADITTSFVVLMGIFFPSVTGASVTDQSL